MSNVKYKFQTMDDLLFYILNAAGHDFIHDFNNYGRMAKILNYIMGLVQGLGKLDTEGTQLLGSVQALASEVVAPPENIPEYEDERPTPEPTPTSEPTPTPEPTPNTENDTIIDNPVDNSTQAISTNDLVKSQIDENLRDEKIQLVPISTTSSDNQIVAITNHNIVVFNNIISEKTSVKRDITRATYKKLNALQKLKDFIQESKFLIISKLQSPSKFPRKGKQTGKGKPAKKQTGGNGIDIITRDDIIASIKDIIEEIKETTPQNLQLISYFEYIMYSYLNLSIPGISPLEIFNNSLIEDSASIFIVGQCNNTNIKEQAKLCLTALLSVSSTSEAITEEETPLPMNMSLDKAKGQNDISKFIARGFRPPSRKLPTSLRPLLTQGGGAFNGTTYKDNKSTFDDRFETLISSLEETLLLNYYKGNVPGDLNNSGFAEEIYRNYNLFVEAASNIQIQGTNVIELIVGKQMLNVKTTIIRNKHEASQRGGRNLSKYIQEMVDTITDLIFVKTIDVYNDVKNRSQARNEDSGDGSSITGDAKAAVQNVSKLVATKILQLTGAPESSPPSDLNTQIQILTNVANGRGYTSADDVLIDYFIRTYGNKPDKPNVSVGDTALGQLKTKLGRCEKKTCRVINNAVPSDVKERITQIVVCPTSSVCDGMASFGSCVNPRGNKEYANMNFSVTFGDESNYYYGQTNIKSDLTSVNINYGIKYGDLQIYNFIDIKIDSQPIVLQANYVFKNLINRIIEIWKSQVSITNIDDLWKVLDGTDYFLSILKLGSQKAVGDIFQEINSTLSNGGYNVEVQNLENKDTYGLMGDRPSGVRVFKLLNNVGPLSASNQGKNPRASGGYVGSTTTFMYFSSPPSSPPPPPVKKKRKGGNKITRKRKYKITNKYYRRRGKQTKRKNKHNKTK